jgi:hypothetical protein
MPHKKVSVVHYSQSGQLNGAIESESGRFSTAFILLEAVVK